MLFGNGFGNISRDVALPFPFNYSWCSTSQCRCNVRLNRRAGSSPSSEVGPSGAGRSISPVRVLVGPVLGLPRRRGVLDEAKRLVLGRLLLGFLGFLGLGFWMVRHVDPFSCSHHRAVTGAHRGFTKSAGLPGGSRG